uniref:Uncharacterized protein n=1 Tax=Arundo donax TaxID=35708 RepID=A0A0A9EIM5_ARUDO
MDPVRHKRRKKSTVKALRSQVLSNLSLPAVTVL